MLLGVTPVLYFLCSPEFYLWVMQLLSCRTQETRPLSLSLLAAVPSHSLGCGRMCAKISAPQGAVGFLCWGIDCGTRGGMEPLALPVPLHRVERKRVAELE